MGMPVVLDHQRLNDQSQSLPALLLPNCWVAARKLRLLRLEQLGPQKPPLRGWQPALAQQQGVPSLQGCSSAQGGAMARQHCVLRT